MITALNKESPNANKGRFKVILATNEPHEKRPFWRESMINAGISPVINGHSDFFQTLFSKPAQSDKGYCFHWNINLELEYFS